MILLNKKIKLIILCIASTTLLISCSEYNNENKAGKTLYVQNGLIDYSHPDNYIKSLSRWIDKDVWKKSELDFMSKDDAINLAVKTCEDLDININKSPTSVSVVDFETLKEQSDILGPMGVKSAQEDRVITKDNESYIIEFNIEERGILLLQRNITMQSIDRIIEGSNIVIIIDTDEISEFYIDGSIYSEQSIKEENPLIITIDKALEQVTEIYSNILTEDIIVISDIELIYVPCAISKKIFEAELVPTWCFTLQVSGIDKKINEMSSYESYVYINAVTGKEIL